MAVRGEYSKEEEKVVAQARELAGRTEWVGEVPTPEQNFPVVHRVVTAYQIRHFAEGMGDENPLWLDDRYARNTKWGGIIAPPTFPHRISPALGAPQMLDIPQSMGIGSIRNAGTLWEFSSAIHVNDSFKVQDAAYTEFEDKTRLDGKGPRMFLITSDRRYINQRDELVCVARRRRLLIILPPPKEGKMPEMISSHPLLAEYIYPDEELAALDRIDEQAERRGAEPRYWEDVSVGDQVRPVVKGPITIWDQVAGLGNTEGLFSLPVRAMRKKIPDRIIMDPVTGVPHFAIEVHLHDRIAQQEGGPIAFTAGSQMDTWLGHVITNWIGDDGFLRRLDIQHRAINPIGDTVICRGQVVKKYVENGDHLVDMAIWSESHRGWILSPASVTASLPSRSLTEAGKTQLKAETGLKRGNTIRLKERPEWPGGYKLGGMKLRVIDVRQPWGYIIGHVTDIPETAIAAGKISIGNTLIFRKEAVEKI